MTDDEARLEVDRLIAFLRYEGERPNSCTPDIVERFDRAIDEHLAANGEPPRRTTPEAQTPVATKPFSVLGGGLLPCDRGMSSGGRGMHHFQAAPHGAVVCIYCGKAAPAEPIRVTYSNGANT